MDGSSPPSLWRGDEMARHVAASTPSGHPGLDALLPGRGWPQGSLNEVLQPRTGHSEWRLLQPALAQAALAGHIVLIGCPLEPNLHHLAQNGMGPERITWLTPPEADERIWAAEQALHCPDVAAVLLWLPLHTSSTALRRLHRAAQTTALPDNPARQEAPLLFAFRPDAACQQPSPAPLRLRLESLGTQGLRIHLFKRRGTPEARPHVVAAPLPVLQLLEQPLPDGVRLFPFQTRHDDVVDRLRWTA